MKKINVFHIIFISMILCLGLAVILRIKGWVRVVDPTRISGPDEGIADFECHDHIMPLTDYEYNLIRQNEETILILGNDPFASDRSGKNGLGAIINSSRGIMCVWKKQGLTEEDFAEAARAEALRMKDDIISTIGTISL